VKREENKYKIGEKFELLVEEFERACKDDREAIE